MSTNLTPQQRKLRASKAGLTGWDNTVDRSARARHANAGLIAKWEREIDPDGTMDRQELARRVKTKQKLHMADMSWKAVQARRAKAEERQRQAAAMKAKRGPVPSVTD